MKTNDTHIILTKTRQKILDSAAELFAKDGYYKVSVREICKFAGVSKPVLYYYFNDKEDLLNELIDEIYLRFDELRMSYISENMQLSEILDATVKIYTQIVKKYPHFIRFSAFVQSNNVPAEIRNKKLKRYKQETRNFTEQIKSSQKLGHIDLKYDPSILSLNYWGSVMLILAEGVVFENREFSIAGRLKKFIKFWKDQYLIQSAGSIDEKN